MQQAYFILGLNGAGKSSYRDFSNFDQLTIIDPDKIKKELGCGQVEAGKKALKLFDDCIKDKKSFLIEATLSSNSTFKQLKKAKDNGYKVNCVYVGLEHLNEHISRVADRVRNGGHNIPREDIVRRFDKSYSNIKKLFDTSDSLLIYDNTTNFSKQFQLINGEMKQIKNPKEWVVKHAILPYKNLEFKACREQAETMIQQKKQSSEKFLSKKNGLSKLYNL